MKKSYKIVIHAVGWFLLFLFELVRQGVLENPETFVFQLKVVLVRVAALIPAVYFTLYYLVPHLFLKDRKTGFVFAFVSTIAVATILMRTLYYFLLPPEREGVVPTYLEYILNFRFTGWLLTMGNITFTISFVLMIYFINKYLQDKKRRLELESDKKEAELKLLKSQVQPHFIFNTLNNIYALSIKNSPDTSEMIYRLSGLLEYMLYDSNKDWISMDREVDYIRNYLEIEKKRYGKRLDVYYSVQGDISKLWVPPLILLPFVENSFKHGLSRQIGDCWLRIDIVYDGNWLITKVENSKSDEDAPDAVKKGGLGIMNVRRRIDILLNGQYELKQLESVDSYLITLKLKPKIKEPQDDETFRKMEVLSNR